MIGALCFLSFLGILFGSTVTVGPGEEFILGAIFVVCPAVFFISLGVMIFRAAKPKN